MSVPSALSIGFVCLCPNYISVPVTFGLMCLYGIAPKFLVRWNDCRKCLREIQQDGQ